MSKNDFVPTTKDGLIPFYDTQVSNLSIQGPILNIPVAKCAATISVCSEAQTAILAAQTAKLAYAASVSLQDAKIAAANAAVRDCAALGKASSGYTPAIGNTMDWIGTSPSFDPTTYKAVLRAASAIAPAQVMLKFLKASGNIDGVNFYMRRQGQTSWIAQGLVLSSPYVDTTPLATAGVPEVREYRVRGVIGDHEIGLLSESAQVVVS